MALWLLRSRPCEGGRGYAHVAPLSWPVIYDVHEGREHMNFSTWQKYSAKRQRNKTREIWEEVEEGEMPLAPYLRLHPEAKLSDADRETLRRWSEERVRELEAAGGSK